MTPKLTGERPVKKNTRRTAFIVCVCASGDLFVAGVLAVGLLWAGVCVRHGVPAAAAEHARRRSGDAQGFAQHSLNGGYQMDVKVLDRVCVRHISRTWDVSAECSAFYLLLCAF